MEKDYELPKGRRITADFDENGIIKVTVQALDSLIGELNYYADKVCDIEKIRVEVADTFIKHGLGNTEICFDILQIIDRKGEQHD